MITSYGRQITYDLARSLAEQGIVIISGLALGVDTEAHEAALLAGMPTIAVLPSPVNEPYPRANQPLADRIIKAGGAVVSEYAADSYRFKQNFVARNRIVSALSDIVVITEAAVDSGSLHTAAFARKQGRSVFAVPGSISSPASVGANNLLKLGRATAVTCADDILKALKRPRRRTRQRNLHRSNPQEQQLLDLLATGLTHADDLCEAGSFDISTFNQVIATLEISGAIRSLGENNWGVS